MSMLALDTLRRYGVDVNALVDCGFSLYEGEEVGASEERELKERLKSILLRNLNDPNVALLIAAASHLEELSRSVAYAECDLDKDPASLVADELIGMSVAEYIAGKKGLFNYVRYDRAKPGILARLPPFMDDAVGALVAASMTRLFGD